jgi:hypothetical protein
VRGGSAPPSVTATPSPHLTPPFLATVLVFTAAALVAVAFRAALPPALRLDQGSDYRDFYEPVGRRIAAGLGPTDERGMPAIAYPPGYPLLLAGSFAVCRLLHLPDDEAPLLLGIIGTALVAAVLFQLAANVWGARHAFAVAALWSLYPLGLWLTKQPSTEIPFIVFLYAAVALAWRAGGGARAATISALLAGILVGFAMLVRPIAIAAGALLGAVLLATGPRPGRGRLAAALLVGNALVVLPWEVWVYGRLDQFVVLGTGGLPSIRDGLVFAVDGKAYRRAVALPPDVLGLMQDLRVRPDALASLPGLASLLAEEARRRPAGMAELFALKAARSWYGTDSGLREGWIVPVQILYVALGAAGVRATWHAGPAARRLAVLVVTLVLYFWAVTIAVLSIARYMVPAVGLLCTVVPAVLARHARRDEQHQ